LPRCPLRKASYLVGRGDISGKRIILIGAPIFGELTDDFQTFAEDQIRLLYQEGVDVKSIRRAAGLLENSLNMLPRREDLAKPIPYELLMAAPKLVLDESLA